MKQAEALASLMDAATRQSLGEVMLCAWVDTAGRRTARGALAWLLEAWRILVPDVDARTVVRRAMRARGNQTSASIESKEQRDQAELFLRVSGSEDPEVQLVIGRVIELLGRGGSRVSQHDIAAAEAATEGGSAT